MFEQNNNQDLIKQEIKLTKEEISYIKKICSSPILHHTKKTEMLLSHFNVELNVMLGWLEELSIVIVSTQFAKARLHKLKEKKRYIISSAQTASPCNIQLLKNIETYAKFIDAEIGIIATRYKNPTSLWREEGEVWDTATHRYLTATRQQLHKQLIVLADLKIQATAPNPTNGIECFGDSASIIVGAPKIEMRVVASLDNQPQKFLHSTGSVTAPSFTDTVAGGKAAEHHSYGFIVVEIESEDIVHIRNVSASEDGSFNDLIYRVDNEQVTEETQDCMIWGDSHFAQKNNKVTEAFRKVTTDLGVTTSVLHDIFDSQSMNVHNIKNPIVQHQLMTEDKDDFKKELQQMYKELNWFETNMKETIVVSSNHDDMVDRALVQSDWKDNLKNAVIFTEMLLLKLNGKADKGVIPFFINKKYKTIKALGLDDSYIRHGIELGMHGHAGPNGSKGNILSFSRLASKTVIGHSHSPAIKGGCYQVGLTCGMSHGYNHGLSGWSYASCLLNKHGKRQMIVLNKKTLTYTTLY